MSSVFGQLVVRTDEARRQFETHPVLLAAVADGMSLPRYRALLLELYHVVWHFNPVCASAASRMPDSLRELRYFLYEHMQEESGHEQWVENDLDAIGVDRTVTRSHAPSADTLALVGYNHWAADRRHPASVLGMLYALEVIASVYGGPFSAAVKESLLLEGERGISFIASHATMDAKHMAELREIMVSVPGADALDAIAESATVNFHHLTRIVEAI
ncbi:MAG: iron-containing redox enzyme family protein [Rubrivivax sp.]|nr:iron-containing redox enzyme family protein [Rubrivivax sp.]